MRKYNSHVTYFRWKINNFQDEWIEGSKSGEEEISGGSFMLNTRPWISFELRFDAGSKIWTENQFFVNIINDKDEGIIEASYKIWFETKKREKFYEYSNKKCAIDTGDYYYLTGIPTENEDAFKIFKKIYDNNEAIFVFFEIADLGSTYEEYSNHCRNQWKLYEEGVHDAKIFVGPERKEFKILKAFFMAQSPVFRAMFQSDFLEAKENEVFIGDMDEETMLALIKWIYLAKIEDCKIVEKLFEAADKYQIEMLKKACVERMSYALNIQNVFSRLAIAALYGYEELKLTILDFVNELSRHDLAECLMSKEWRDFSNKKPQAADEVSKLILDKLE